MSQGTVEKLYIINVYAWLEFRVARAAQSITPVYFKACSVPLLAALRNRTQKIKTYIPEKQNYNSSAAQRINKYTFLSQLSVINTRNKLVIFFEETYVFIFVYVIPKGRP